MEENYNILKRIEEVENLFQIALHAAKQADIENFKIYAALTRNAIEKLEETNNKMAKLVASKKKYELNKLTMELYFVQTFTEASLKMLLQGDYRTMAFLSRNFSIFFFDYIRIPNFEFMQRNRNIIINN